MPRIGLFEYPNLTVTEAIEAARSPEGRDDGSLRDLLAYGVLEKDNDAAALTALGRRLIDPANRDDFARGVAEAVFNVQLLRTIWEGLTLAELKGSDAILVALVAITGVMVADAETHSGAIQRLLAALPVGVERNVSEEIATLRKSLRAENASAVQGAAIANTTERKRRGRDSSSSRKSKSPKGSSDSVDHGARAKE